MRCDELNVLKRELENQIMQNEPYEKIYATSVKIDKLLIKYYEKCNLSKDI